MTTGTSAAETCARLRATLESVLDRTIPRGARTVLAGSGLSNAGDCVIAEATRASLASRDAAPRLDVGRRTYRPSDVDAALGADGVLLLAGGGTIGDVWPSQEAFRRRLLAEHRERSIVQMPQTVRFDDPANAAASKAAFLGARRLTLLVRDRESVVSARELLGLEATLVPDSAFLTTPAVVPPPPPPPAPSDTARSDDAGVLFLLREDQEAIEGRAAVASVDWPEIDDRRRLRRRRRLAASLAWTFGVGPRRRARVEAIERELSAERAATAFALVRGARAIVTDRLHGGIVALLAGRPVILLPDRFGKVAAHHAAWTSGCADVRTAPDLATARRILDEGWAPSSRGGET